MVGHNCYMCGNDSLFFYWSSGRRFPRKKLIDKLSIKNKTTLKVLTEGVPICYHCYNQIK